MNHNCSLRLANLSDISVIRSLAEDIWNKHYPSIIGQAQVDYMLKQNYSVEKIAADITNGTQTYYLLEEDQQPLGFCAVSNTSPEEAFLHKLYVNEATRGRGLGAWCLQELQLLYPEWNILRLQVNRQNYTAINFYFKMGFTIEQVADFEIGEGYQMNDFMMKLNCKKR